MNFLKIDDEINFSNKMYFLRREIENILYDDGFKNIEPSIFENYDEFTDVNFRIDKKSTVKLLDNSGDILILSPDITTGIVNKLMNRWESGLKLKLFYYGKTYMHSGSGIKEKRQMGVEYIGEKNQKTDENILNIAIKIMDKYCKNYLFEMSDSRFLKGLMQACSFNKEDYDNILNLIYSKNKQGLKEYIEKLPYREPMSTLLNIFDLEGTFEEIKNSLEGLYMNDLMQQAIEEISSMDKFFNGLTDRLTYDLSMVTELSYYDGVIFRAYMDSSNKEIIKGGRYDSFTEQYGCKVPAIGFSIELDELIKSLIKEDM